MRIDTSIFFSSYSGKPIQSFNNTLKNNLMNICKFTFMIISLLFINASLVSIAFAETNLVLNSGFEYGDTTLVNWDLVTNNKNIPVWDTVSQSGSRSIKISVPGTIIMSESGSMSSPYIDALPSKQYTFSAWGKTSGLAGNAIVYLVELGDSSLIAGHTIVFSNGTQEWTKKEISFTTLPDTKSMYIVSRIESGYGNFWVDDLGLSPTNPALTSTLAPASTPEPTPAPTPKKVELGNYAYYGYGHLSFQDDPKLTFDMTLSVNDMRQDPGITKVWEKQIYSSPIPQTNFAWIKNRFDLAENNKDKNWQYGSYLLLEEVYHPAVSAQWRPYIDGIDTWDIEGSATFAGVTIMHLKPWYIQEYGSWDQEWWDYVKSENSYNDEKIMKWSTYFGYNLHKAWNQHMRNIGKKPAIIGIVGIPEVGPNGMFQFETWLYPPPMWQYVLENYDLVFSYQYPTCVSCEYTDSDRPISASLDVVKLLREKYNYKGKIVQILTAVWPDGEGTDSETVQFEEFKLVYPYVDSIIVPPYTNVEDGSKNYRKEPYPPRLLKFYNNINP